MIPSPYEYATLLGLFLLVNYAVFPEETDRVLSRRGFWISQAIFALFGFFVDFLAIKLEWWAFSANHLLGQSLFGVPVEEFILFFLFHLYMCVSWEAFDDMA